MLKLKGKSLEDRRLKDAYNAKEMMTRQEIEDRAAIRDDAAIEKRWLQSESCRDRSVGCCIDK
jgi:hypothetical protein